MTDLETYTERARLLTFKLKIAQDAIDAVHKLHNPIQIYNSEDKYDENDEIKYTGRVCAECTDASTIEALADEEADTSDAIMYPCPTVKAVNEALAVPPPWPMSVEQL